MMELFPPRFFLRSRLEESIHVAFLYYFPEHHGGRDFSLDQFFEWNPHVCIHLRHEHRIVPCEHCYAFLFLFRTWVV